MKSLTITQIKLDDGIHKVYIDNLPLKYTKLSLTEQLQYMFTDYKVSSEEPCCPQCKTKLLLVNGECVTPIENCIVECINLNMVCNECNTPYQFKGVTRGIVELTIQNNTVKPLIH